MGRRQTVTLVAKIAPPQIYRADWVLPIANPPIKDGAVLVEHGVIRAVGKFDAVRSRFANSDITVEYVEGTALLPGFINAHTHLELTCYHNQLQRAPLWDWFDALIPIRREPGAELREAEGMTRSIEMCLAAGVTTVGDITRTGAAIACLIHAPIRKVCFLELISGASQPPSNVPELIAMIDRLQAERIASDATYADRLHLGISPHAPYTVRPQEIAACIALARERQLPFTMHLLETREEADWLRGQGHALQQLLEDRGLATGAARPADSASWYESTNMLRSEGLLLAHMNYADEHDFERIAAVGASVVWCPRAHAYFGHRNHPWQSFIALGVNVCIGTDSLASNESLSILDELRFVARQTPQADAHALLHCGTLAAARALGLDDCIGSLEPGKRADFIACDLDQPTHEDAAAAIVKGTGTIRATWIDGACVYRRE